MEESGVLVFGVLVLLTGLLMPSQAAHYQETNTEVCYNDVFRPSCLYKQQIFITQAKYGHIQASKCVDQKFETFGEFGCYADVLDILSAKCGGKARCEIPMQDPEIIATKTCMTGLPMYLDVTYICIPETIQKLTCSGVTSERKLQYITSTQIESGSCVSPDDGISKQTIFTAVHNLNIKFTFSPLQTGNNTTQPYGYIVDKIHGNTAIVLSQSNTEVVTQSNEVTLLISHDSPGHFIIGFQETGCQDFVPPRHTWMKRTGDTTIIGCHNNNLTWQLKCVTANWIGFTGNCTNEVKAIVQLESVPDIKYPSVKEDKLEISKEILFALIIGITVFLCAVVIVTGFVCVKRAKYKLLPCEKNSVEMNTIVFDGEGTTSWTRGKSLNGQPAVNNVSNVWHQQTLPVGQKYYVLDREDVNTLRT